MIEKIKKNWKVIVIILLTLMFMGKCTQSCNRDDKVKKLTLELAQRDSMIQKLNLEIMQNESDITSLEDLNNLLKENNKSMENQIYKKDSINASQRVKIIQIKK